VLVTVGIPFCNGSATLSDAIRSVFAQTLDDWELLLVDDGSGDESLGIARSVHDGRVRVISDGVNRGLPYRLNQIAEAARGKYIARLDDDDLMHPERLEQQVQYLETHPDVDVMGTSVYTIALNGSVSGLRIVDETTLTHKNVVARCVLIHPTVLGRAEWFKRYAYDSGYVRAEDHELWARTFSKSTFRVYPEPLTYYREGRSRTIRKYLLSKRTDLRIFLTYGPSVARWPTIVKWMALSGLKIISYSSLWVLGLNELALRHSRASVDANLLESAQRTLADVRRTPVPGLSENIRA
jgi:glycosyltransferase involved in cell wall biosynthesis